MGRIFAIAASLSLICGFAIVSGQTKPAPPPVFKSAQLLSASDVPIPFNSVANGIVLLRATIDKKGSVQDIAVIRQLASVTEVAEKAVKDWTFSPGTVDEKPSVTQVAIAVVFCPVGPSLGELTLAPLDSEAAGDSPAAYPSQLPDVTAAAYTPNTTPFAGTVVLQATISSSGGLDYTKVVKDYPGLTPSCLRTLDEKWKFAPALMDGKPVRSTMIIAFAIRNPTRYSY